MTRATMVQVHDPRVRWSVPAADVLRIVSAREWEAAALRALLGASPGSAASAASSASRAIDLLSALGPVPRTEQRDRRVLVVRGARDREAALIAGGPVKIDDVSLDDVLPLPPIFAASVPEIAAIAVSSDASLSLVIAPSRVERRDAAPPEEPCPSRS